MLALLVAVLWLFLRLVSTFFDGLRSTLPHTLIQKYSAHAIALLTTFARRKVFYVLMFLGLASTFFDGLRVRLSYILIQKHASASHPLVAKQVFYDLIFLGLP